MSNNNNNKSIFISNNDHDEYNDIAGKLTYTSIYETIPDNKVEKQLNNWNKIYVTEWRWRFLRINYNNKNRYVVEISFIKYNSDKRMYFNRFGNWVERIVDPIYDKFVEKEYFVYTNT